MNGGSNGTLWHQVLTSLQGNEVGLAAGLLVAATCAYIGVYVVLKRIVFVGAALSQTSSAGIALAFMLAPMSHDMEVGHTGLLASIGHGIGYMAKHPMLMAFLVTSLGVLFLATQGRNAKIPHESFIGIGYAVAAALTILFIVKSPQGIETVHELLDGSIIAVNPDELKLMALLFGAITLTHLLFYKQFLFVAFDPETAATQGFRVRRWEALFYLLLGLAISASIQSAGLLSVFAYLVIPAATGLLVARCMLTAFAVAIASALVSTVLGFVWSLRDDYMPTPPPTITIMAAILLAVWFFRRFSREV